MQRLFYFFYYLKTTAWKKLKRFLQLGSHQSARSQIALMADSVISSFRYKISLLDYFYFRFYALPHTERVKWAGTGYMYEYQLQMNPKKFRKALENKIEFLNLYRSFIKRGYIISDELSINSSATEQLLNKPSGKLVLKNSRGQAGNEIEIISSEGFTPDTLKKYMLSKKFDLAEEYITQHPEMMKLSPSGVNTVRIITQIIENSVEILAARLRISVDSPVDNLAAGNLAAPVDIASGVVAGPAVYSDITKNDQTHHPVTGTHIVGFQIPFWQEVIQMAKDAAQLDTRNRSIGWDIAITSKGPELIEGNHNWCKLLWQLPVKKGLKHELEKFH